MDNTDEITVYRSEVSFDIVHGVTLDQSYPFGRILVDGVPFLQLVRDYETTMLRGNKEASLAGSYWYLDVASLIEFLESPQSLEGYRIALLGCNCHDLDCWPLVCSMCRQDDDIIWYDFFQPHRKTWDYSGFGPFAFDMKDFFRALDGLKSAYSEHPAP